MDFTKIAVKTITETLLQLDSIAITKNLSYPFEEPSSAIQVDFRSFIILGKLVEKKLYVNIETMKLSDYSEPATCHIYFEESPLEYIVGTKDTKVLSNYTSLTHKGLFIRDGKHMDIENANPAALRKIAANVIDPNIDIMPGETDRTERLEKPLLALLSQTHYI